MIIIDYRLLSLFLYVGSGPSARLFAYYPQCAKPRSGRTEPQPEPFTLRLRLTYVAWIRILGGISSIFRDSWVLGARRCKLPAKKKSIRQRLGRERVQTRRISSPKNGVDIWALAREICVTCVLL